MKARSKKEVGCEDRFVNRCEELGVLALKLEIPGNRHFPDRLVLARKKTIFFVEFKAPKKTMRRAQTWVADHLEKMGFRVYRDVTTDQQWEEILDHEIPSS